MQPKASRIDLVSFRTTTSPKLYRSLGIVSSSDDRAESGALLNKMRVDIDMRDGTNNEGRHGTDMPFQQLQGYK